MSDLLKLPTNKGERPRAFRSLLRLTALSVALGVLAAFISFADRNVTDITTLYPELGHVPSVFIESRGFPFAQWASNDPEESGYGTFHSEFVPFGILANAAIFSMVAFSTLVSIWLSFRLVLHVCRRRHRSVGQVKTSLGVCP